MKENAKKNNKWRCWMCFGVVCYITLQECVKTDENKRSEERQLRKYASWKFHLCGHQL